MRLSVLDQSPVSAGGAPADAVSETVQLARAAERLGYHRFWVAEHHGSAGLAGTVPEILVVRIASATTSMRVGSGGVMLSHYSPYKVAETFRMLETLFPGRIDLGIGRAAGADPLTALALRNGAEPLRPERFPDQVADLIGFLSGKLDAAHPFAGLSTMPSGAGVPEIWLLGSSDQSAQLAAFMGLAFSFAQFINEGGEGVMEAYRQCFRSSPHCRTASGSVAVFVICADSESEALRLEASRNLWRLRSRQEGELPPYPSVADALSYAYAEADRVQIERSRRRNVVGAPEQIKARLNEIANAYGVDELVIVTICHDFGARLRSYELLAQAFQITKQTDRGEGP
ncbi:MAG: LLM class flavin-dependent oxidoreductase [Rhodospirillales bacterium]|nr:LLM class flavin-dependent oxidoreductase [Rhodospirillales bacterium]